MPDERPTAAEVLAKAGSRLRARGAGEVLAVLAARLRAEVLSSERLVFLVREAGGRSPEREGVELRLATERDGRRYARDIGTDSPSTFASRLSECTGCFLVLEGERVLHATWITRAAAWTRELRSYVRPPPGDAYVYESFTRSDARGRGLYPLALFGICAHLGERAVRRVWVGVENHNVASLRAVAKAGFVEVLSVDYRRRLGRLTVDPPHGPGAGEADGSIVVVPAAHGPPRGC